ncbi:hypothetical protein [Serpentinicella alkaliphila]|uniref:GAF domain-containing protein n=1 Tax=Serpentinicella alkaliphila TaxID=1734049 RepID=A0A4R2TTG3_9FIRM|nr:hypothetical protein [Serpentinicella alkaliphila]QUH25249.1 hypothetical protein HZR23_05375 [Serpentinicella alkaliphila]TCQ07061.1 hypothetical protein EDD79_100257 [Serpentinicella alkaliphila]
MYRCICENRKIVEIIPKEVFGIPFKSITVPLRNSKRKAIGSINIGRSLKRQNTHKELTENIAAAFEEIIASVNEISNSAIGIANSSEKR